MGNMFEMAMNEMKEVEQITKKAVVNTLLWALRAGVAEAKKTSAVVTGNLQKKYDFTKPVNAYGKYVGDLQNNADYASFEELGHRQKKRFVPGVLKNGKFFYDPKAKTGMMLSEKWVQGSFCLTIIADKYNKMIPETYEREFTRLLKERGIKQ